jgi:hypothetical protein
MERTYWIPLIGGLMVAVVLAIPAGLGDWSAAAVHGILFASIVTAAVLFALTDRGQRSSHR